MPRNNSHIFYNGWTIFWLVSFSCGNAAAFTVPFMAAERVAEIQVCQNKDCCKRWQQSYPSATLPDILRDLLEPSCFVNVETTGCLSQCDKGPNIVFKARGKQKLVQGLYSISLLIEALEKEFGKGIVPPKLIAACRVLGKAHEASSFDEKHRFLNSVVSVLEGEPELAQSSALARALVSRAQARYEDQHTEEALGDALRATSMKSTSWNALSWRMVADCYKTLGKPDEAIAALREWGSCEPAFRSKVNREIQELRRLL